MPPSHPICAPALRGRGSQATFEYFEGRPRGPPRCCSADSLTLNDDFERQPVSGSTGRASPTSSKGARSVTRQHAGLARRHATRTSWRSARRRSSARWRWRRPHDRRRPHRGRGRRPGSTVDLLVDGLGPRLIATRSRPADALGRGRGRARSVGSGPVGPSTWSGPAPATPGPPHRARGRSAAARADVVRVRPPGPCRRCSIWRRPDAERINVGQVPRPPDDAADRHQPRSSSSAGPRRPAGRAASRAATPFVFARRR